MNINHSLKSWKNGLVYESIPQQRAYYFNLMTLTVTLEAIK